MDIGFAPRLRIEKRIARDNWNACRVLSSAENGANFKLCSSAEIVLSRQQQTQRFRASYMNRAVPIGATDLVGTHDILFITLGTLRYDVAQECWLSGRTPTLASLLPATGWERRHSPGNFSYAAHHAFFAGFLPAPIGSGSDLRRFAIHFPGSETPAAGARLFNAPDIVTGIAQCGYHTICIGGAEFFNKLTPLGNVFPSLFAESYWSPLLGITDPQSTENQVGLALERIREIAMDKRIFLFLNVSAIHTPNCFYLPGATKDSMASHAAALEYVDQQLAPLIATLRHRAPVLAILCSDHGTIYGEEEAASVKNGAHATVWDVPYAEALLGQTNGEQP